ncbi:MAG: hypothetical protein GY952_06645 [Rhodobacteraceae bacterium]|nr:hypothetical protein [Paracoccaceae bacterium]
MHTFNHTITIQLGTAPNSILLEDVEVQVDWDGEEISRVRVLGATEFDRDTRGFKTVPFCVEAEGFLQMLVDRDKSIYGDCLQAGMDQGETPCAQSDFEEHNTLNHAQLGLSRRA